MVDACAWTLQVPGFPDTLIVAKPTQSESTEEKESGIVGDTSESSVALQEIQNVFKTLHLGLAEKTLNPIEFVSRFKGWGGEAINPKAQMDVAEFMGLLFDRLEPAVKVRVLPILFLVSCLPWL